MLIMTLVTLVEIVAAVSMRGAILVHLRGARAILLRSRIAITTHIGHLI